MASANCNINDVHQLPREKPVVAHVIYTFDMGGAQRRIIDLIHDPAEAVHHVIIALDGKFGAAEKITTTDTHTLLSIEWTSQPVYKAIWRAKAILQQLRPDVVCGYNWAGAEWSMAGRLVGVPRIYQIEDGFGTDESMRPSRKRGFFRYVLTCGSKNVHLVVVSHTMKQIARKVWRIPAGKIVHIPNGVDLAEIQSGHMRPAPLLPVYDPEDIVIGWLGALRPEKRVNRLIQAFRQSAPPAAKLVIMGEGRLRSELEHMASSDARIIFTGNVDDPAAYLARLDGLALTSETEQTPYVLAEAMAAGLACLVTDVGDCRRMLAKENMPFVIHDLQDLALTLATFIQDTPQRRAIGQANAIKAQKVFNLETMRQRYRKLLA